MHIEYEFLVARQCETFIDARQKFAFGVVQGFPTARETKFLGVLDAAGARLLKAVAALRGDQVFPDPALLA